jgi:hypothetical protein
MQRTPAVTAATPRANAHIARRSAKVLLLSIPCSLHAAPSAVRLL